MNPWTPRTTVAAVIETDGRFLMVEELDALGRRVINQPAGHLEPREAIVDAVRREVMEETGWTFSPAGLVGIYKWRLPERDITYVRYCFFGTATPASGECAVDDDILAIHRLTAEDVFRDPARHRSPMVARCLRDYLNNHRFGLEIIHELD